jgi:hypothetical protein
MFEQMPGLKSTLTRVKFLIIGGDNNTAIAYADIFNCQIGMFPLKYLGDGESPISASQLPVIDWIKLEEKL